MENVVFNKEENGFIYLDSTMEIGLDEAVELCKEYKLKDGGYIFVSYEL